MNFGCGACSREDAEAAWQHFRHDVDTEAPIVDDPHFIVRIVRCRACSQPFIRIFTEFIDWSGGDDPQYTTIMPVTEAEAAAFTDGSLSVFQAGKIGAGRRHLLSDWPSGQARRISWGEGTFLVSEGGLCPSAVYLSRRLALGRASAAYEARVLRVSKTFLVVKTLARHTVQKPSR